MDKQKFFEAYQTANPFTNNLGVVIDKIEDGYAEGHLDVKPWLYNGRGFLHGGVYFSFADTLCGAAIMSYGRKVVTLEAKMNYIAPIHEGTVYAKAQVEHCGHTTGVVGIKLYNEQGQLLTVGTYTMFMLDEYWE